MGAPIIAAYEPFHEDRAPVALALAAAELTGAPVLAAAVAPEVLVQAWADAEPLHEEIVAITKRALAALHADAGVVTRLVTDASVPRALHALAEEEGARLLIVGSTTRALLGRVLPGSTAERLLDGASCPVALAPHGYERRAIRTVAVGFAATPEGHAALAAGHALAERAGATLRVISAVHPSGALDSAFARGTPPLRGVELEGRGRAEHEAAMARAVDALPNGVTIEQELHVDDPAEVLLRISAHVDLLVCGSRGYGPVRGLLLGGVTRRVLAAAHCPVLILPRGVAFDPGALVGEAAADTAATR
jgi:nucleotide-binding universal stress UspA family protein